LTGAKKFLENGHKVRVELILRGREKAHSDLANEIVENFVAAIRETYPLRIEQPIKKQDGRVTMIVARE
jgi:translation initiation factor IF-3